MGLIQYVNCNIAGCANPVHKFYKVFCLIIYDNPNKLIVVGWL